MSSEQLTAYSTPEMDYAPGIDDYLAALKRRLKPMLIVSTAVLILAVLAAVLWPPTYSSSATILIEEQEIPQDMVRSTITTFATQQIEVIRQRVLTLKNIMEIVKKYGVYDEDELSRISRAEVVEAFIAATSVELLNTAVIDPRSGRPVEATIAFTIEFEANSPRKSLNVSNELVNLFLNENLRNRAAKASSTSDFLRNEANDLGEEVKTIEAEIARFKAEHQAALPESFQLNMQNLTRYQTQLLSAESRVQEFAKRELQLEAQLVSTSAYAPTILPSGQAVMADVDRLKALQSDYRTKAARYSEQHPDVVRLKREIDALASQVGHAGNKADLVKLLNGRKAELVSLKAQYSEDHPEVIAQQQLILQLEDQVEKSTSGDPEMKPDNPAYVMLDNQLKSLQMEKSALQGQIISTTREIEKLNQAAIKAPVIEREYNDLLRNREVATAKMVDLRIKLKEAELAGQLEEGRMAQRFTLIEPPALPQKPKSPNRIVILFLGALFAGAAGLGVCVLLELADPSIRSAKALGALAGVPPLVTIPYIETPAEKSTNSPKRKLYIFLGGGFIAAVIFLVCIHYFFKPLDVLWFVILGKLGIG
ncbi:MAG: Wzz/FepE/Etk N-terminal domain-containing protein [Halioglobus sp.]